MAPRYRLRYASTWSRGSDRRSRAWRISVAAASSSGWITSAAPSSASRSRPARSHARARTGAPGLSARRRRTASRARSVSGTVRITSAARSARAAARMIRWARNLDQNEGEPTDLSEPDAHQERGPQRLAEDESDGRPDHELADDDEPE